MASSEDPTRIHPTAPAPPSPPPAGPGLTPHEPLPGGPGGPTDPPLPPTGGPGGGGGWDDGPDEPQDDEKKRNWALFVIAGALVLIALFLGLSLLQSDDDEPTVASTPTEVVAPETTPVPPTTPRAEPVTPPPAPSTPDTSGNGNGGSGGGNTNPTTPVDEGPLLEAGSVTKIKVGEGDTVAFRVKSDTDEEVHVHGYDQTFDVRAGQTKAISFTADLTGIFEIEFEGSATQIGELTVEP